MSHGQFKCHNSVSILALADRARRRDRAAPVARRLATGVGSRVELPRNAARSVGSTQLARQTRFALAQRGRIRGCVVVTTQKMGGRDVSRPAFWRANTTKT